MCYFAPGVQSLNASQLILSEGSDLFGGVKVNLLVWCLTERRDVYIYISAVKLTRNNAKFILTAQFF